MSYLLQTEPMGVKKMSEIEDEHHEDDCPKCGAEEALLYTGGDATPMGGVLNKRYICDECGKWVNEDELE